MKNISSHFCFLNLPHTQNSREALHTARGMYCMIHLLEIIRLSDFSSPLFYPSLLAYSATLTSSALFQIWNAQCTLGWSGLGGTVSCAVLKSVIPGTAFLCVLCWMVQKSNVVHEKKNVHSACLYMPWIDVHFGPFLIANLSSYRAGQ